MQTSVLFYKAVVQYVLRFGLDMWVMNPHINRALGGFHFWAYGHPLTNVMEFKHPHIQAKTQDILDHRLVE